MPKSPRIHIIWATSRRSLQTFRTSIMSFHLLRCSLYINKISGIWSTLSPVDQKSNSKTIFSSRDLTRNKCKLASSTPDTKGKSTPKRRWVLPPLAYKIPDKETRAITVKVIPTKDTRSTHKEDNTTKMCPLPPTTLNSLPKTKLKFMGINNNTNWIKWSTNSNNWLS